MNNNNKLIFAIILLNAALWNNNPANAATFLPAPANCAGLAGIPANQVYKYDPVGMKQLLRLGCPPPKLWRKAVNHELAAGGGMSGFSAAARVPAHKSSLGYKARGACSDLKVTKAGGLSDFGASDPCFLGLGWPFFNINIPMPNIPTINPDEINCMGNLFEQVLNGGPVTADLNLSGTCAVGTIKTSSVGQCGISSRSGSVCTTTTGTAETTTTSTGTIDKPFARTDAPKYVPVSDVPEMKYMYNSLNIMTAIYLPDGGTVQSQYKTYNLDPGMFVTMNADGQVFIGPDNGTLCYDYDPYSGGYYYNGCRIDLSPAPLNADPAVGSYVTIIPNGQVVNVDSTIFEGDTLNKTTQYVTYTPTSVINTNDGRPAPTAGNPYDPRTNITGQNVQTGPGPQNCLSAPIADLAGIPLAQDYCVGAQQVGLSDLVLDPTGAPTIACPPSVSLFCVQDTLPVNSSAPDAPQQP